MANMICNDIVPVQQAKMQDLVVVHEGKSTVLRSIHPAQCTFSQLLQQVTEAITDDIIAITGGHQTVMIQLFSDLPGSEGDILAIADDADMKEMFSVHQDDDLILLIAETTVIETLSFLPPQQVREAA